MKKNNFIKLIIGMLLCQVMYAQQQIFIPVEFQRAVDAGTRTLKGKPGNNYFQNSANYDINVHFDPATALLKGNAKITYFNNSTDSLRSIVFRLYANLFKKGTVRQAVVEAEDVHDGVQIKQFEIKDKEMDISKTKQHETIMIVPLNEKLAPKSSLNIEVDWETTLPNKTLIRMGRYDTSTYFVAYWYPQIAVYDDIFRWCTDSYTGLQEFYCDNANFNVQITVPKGYLVWATGVLQNEQQLFAKNILTKIEKASKSDELVRIVTKQELENNQVLQNNANELTWSFKADEVPDFAFGVSNSYVWDGTSVMVDSVSKRRAMANAVYHKNSEAGDGVAMIARRTMQALSHEIIGYPYPYPHNTVWEGHFGMEFPMMCNDGPVMNCMMRFLLLLMK